MKVWLYYRLSRDEDEELNSLINQRKIIYEYALPTVTKSSASPSMTTSAACTSTVRASTKSTKR